MSGCGVRWQADCTHTCYCHPEYPYCDGHNHVCMCGGDYTTEHNTKQSKQEQFERQRRAFNELRALEEKLDLLD